MREENNILGMINDEGIVEPIVFGSSLIKVYDEDYINVYNKETISVAEMIDLLDEMDFCLKVVGMNFEDNYITLRLIDIQDYSSSMNDLEFEVSIESEEKIRRDMYEILIGNFENHLDDYGIEFEWESC